MLNLLNDILIRKMMMKIEKLKLIEVSKQKLKTKQLKDIKGGNPNCVPQCGYVVPVYASSATWLAYF